jgi:hypothetical protein
MFEERRSLPDIVIETEETPETIRALFEQYKRPLEPSEDGPTDQQPANTQSESDDSKTG